MENPFDLTDEQLKTLLDAYTAWYKNNPKEEKYINDDEQKLHSIKEYLLNKTYLENASEEELTEKILKYSKSLEGPVQIKIGEQRVREELEHIKRNLLYLLESNDDPISKAFLILDGDYRIPIFAKAFWTPIFQACYPNVLPNWNNKTEDFLKKVGINIGTSKLTVKEKYRSISDAFLYLQKIDPKQSFHNINHLMHYGTVIEEGKLLLEKLFQRVDKTPIKVKNELEHKITEIRKRHVSEKRISLRKEYELKARKLIESKIGNFKEDDLRDFFKLVNHDIFNDQLRYNRFGMAYVGNNVNALVDQLPAVNEWIKSFWESNDDLVSKLDQFYKSRPLKNAGIAFPSLILYLRDPSKYNLCFKRMVQGLSYLTGFSQKGYSGKLYIKYNDALNDLRDKFDLSPQEMDILLTVDVNEDVHNDNGFNDHETNESYTIPECSDETAISINTLQSWVKAIERKGQAVIYGPPGTGKTFVAQKIAKHLISDSDGFSELIQFHSAYSYEDFIQGIRPETRDDGSLEYNLVPGRFIDFCTKAESRDGRCILIIDEINRANLARVFGELMYLLEYREESIPLAGGNTFRIPENVRIIGTMNTADRSIALVDHALRRRFAFLQLSPDMEILRKYHKESGYEIDGLIETLEKLNNEINDPHYSIGVSFFLNNDISANIEDIWKMEIEPYLEEYFFDQNDKVDKYRWKNIQDKIAH